MTANSNTVPKLGFGCMRFPLTDPKDVTAIDIDQVKEMVDLFMDAGGTYFDIRVIASPLPQSALPGRCPMPRPQRLAWTHPSSALAPTTWIIICCTM